MNRQLRIYVDTSVVGGCLDKEFAEASLAFMRMVSRGEIMLLVSNVLADELRNAPEEVQKVLATMPVEHMEPVSESADANKLRDAYLQQKSLVLRIPTMPCMSPWRLWHAQT